MGPRFTAAAVSIAAIAAISSGCTSGSASDGDPGSDAAVGPVAAPAVGQEAILADGRITFGEYEGALEAAFACARAQGVRITEPVRSFGGVTLDYSIAEDERGAKTIDVFDACYEELAMRVDAGFQTSPEVEAAERLYAADMATCVFGDDAADWDLQTKERSARFDAPQDPRFEECRAATADPRSIVATVRNP